MLTIITCRYPENMSVQNVSNYSFRKCWQLYFPELLAIIISEMLAIMFLEIMATKVSNSFSENGDE